MDKRIRTNTKLKTPQEITIPSSVAAVHGLYKKEDNTDKKHPDLSLKYYDFNHQCFSELEKDDLAQITALCKKFSQMTWFDLKQQGGKGKNKTGLAPTIVDRKQLPKSIMVDRISEDISFMELRLSQKARIFGFRSSTTFFLIFLDKDHDIC